MRIVHQNWKLANVEAVTSTLIFDEDDIVHQNWNSAKSRTFTSMPHFDENDTYRSSKVQLCKWWSRHINASFWRKRYVSIFDTNQSSKPQLCKRWNRLINAHFEKGTPYALSWENSQNWQIWKVYPICFFVEKQPKLTNMKRVPHMLFCWKTAKIDKYEKSIPYAFFRKTAKILAKFEEKI